MIMKDFKENCYIMKKIAALKRAFLLIEPRVFIVNNDARN